jgi:SPOR domain
MARSNGNQDRPGGQQGRQPYPAETVDHGLPWATAPAAAPPQSFDPHAAGQLPWPQAQQPFAQGYQQPPHTAPPAQQYHGQPPQAQAYVPPQYPQPPTYAPQADAHHGHYFPQSAQAQPQQDYGQHTAYQPTGYAPHPGYHDPAAQLRGSFPGHAEAPYAVPPTQPGHDPRQFDLGAYGNAPGNAGGGYLDPVTGRTLAPVQQQPGFPAGAQQAPLGKAAPTAQGQEAYDDDEYEDEDEEAPPRKRFGLLKILGVLTLAVGIGGGAAYGIKKFGGSLMSASTKPVTVKAEPGPTKSKPTAAAAVDNKAAERLSGDAMPAVVPAGEAQGDTPGTPRKVQTVAISPPTTANLRPTVSIPGVTVEGGLPLAPPTSALQAVQGLPPVTQAPPGRAVAPPPVAAQPQRAPVAPKVIAAVEDPAVAPAAKAVAARVPVAKQPRQSDAYTPASGVGAATVAAATTAPTATAPARPAGGNGYIAVLVSPSSAVDARKALDDLQGKYSEIIGSKPTDVREVVSPRDGKTYYRAVVGPPGSSEAAKAVCEQMKTAGHQGCFAAPY